MARPANKNPEAQPVGPPEVPPQKGIELIGTQLAKAAEALNGGAISEAALSSWRTVTSAYIEKAFGKGTQHVSSAFNIRRYVNLDPEPGYFDAQRLRDLAEYVTRINGLIELLESEIAIADEGKVPPRAVSNASGAKKVFIVHGHDGESKVNIARFLERLELDAVILHEQPSRGQTLIEKFETNADVAFAVVLLTPDDRGGTADAVYDQQKERARQNVIFELGYFIGRLGRENVCALHSPNIELPSDYTGIVYVSLAGNWQLELATELQAAGLHFDMNKILARRR